MRTHLSIITCLFLVSFFPSDILAASGNSVADQRLETGMRMIGHRLLLCVEDRDSRILPVEEQNGYYGIRFSSEIEMVPDDIVDVIGTVMEETGIAEEYMVSVEQCQKEGIVYSFEVRKRKQSSIVPCTGRILPKDCYIVWIRILDDIPLPKMIQPAAKKNNFNGYYLLYIIPVFLLTFLLFILIRKRKKQEKEEHILSIGNTRFDTRQLNLLTKIGPVELSHKEAQLLLVLYSNVNQAVERQTLLREVWDDQGDYVGRTLDVFISKLRKKFDADPRVKIESVRGVGYKLMVV